MKTSLIFDSWQSFKADCDKAIMYIMINWILDGKINGWELKNYATLYNKQYTTTTYIIKYTLHYTIQ